VIRYFDTSALVKLFIDEEHSAPLAALLDGYRSADDEIASSAILITELHRAARRLAIDVALVDRVLENIDLATCTNELLASAGRLRGEHLRSLDAIHIATALEVRSDTFVSFDLRQLDAANSAGLATLNPSSG
jgi:uncharacterized protein